MSGLHPLPMEAVTQVEPDREREVPDLLVEPAIGTPRGTLGQRHGVGIEVVDVEPRHPGGHACGPLIRIGATERERDPQSLPEARCEPLDDPAVEERPRGERVGDDDPDRRRCHAPARPGSVSATRSASDAPSSP